MRNNIGVGQILILFLLCFLLFGDFSKFYSFLKRSITTINKEIKTFLSENKNKRKGS